MWDAIGIDVGGTGVRAGIVREGRLERQLARPLADRTPGTVLGAIEQVVAELGGAPRVGIGVPGFVSDGVVLASPNFPFWRSVPVRQLLTDRLGVPVAVENDANCAALGAWAEAPDGDLVLLTLGTGVGGGIITGGRLLRGAGGTGAEVGHIYAGGEARCGCGGRGCLETWCGTAGLLRAARELGHPVGDGLAIVDAARAGEDWAVMLMQDAASALGRGLVTLVNLFNPDRVVIAGGLAGASDLFAPAEAWLRDRAIGPSAQRVTVSWAGRADVWAIFGAARAAQGDV